MSRKRPGGNKERSRDDRRPKQAARRGQVNRPNGPRGGHTRAGVGPRLPKESRLIEGWNPVLEALRARRPLQRIWLAADQHKNAALLLELAQKQGVPVDTVDRLQLDNVASTEVHQGVVAVAPPFQYSPVDAILERAKARDEQPFLLLLDHLEDPQNLGSLIRTAECVGVHGVVIPNRRAVGVTAAVGKASAGAIEHMPVAQVGNLVQEIERLQSQGLWVVGAHMSGDGSLFEADMGGPVALVIGAEGKGLSRLVAERCDMLVHIPMWGRLNSLNAAVAGALLMYEVARSRSRNTSSSVTR